MSNVMVLIGICSNLIFSHVLFKAQSFPTPMEEPRKVIRGLFLGSIQVDRATGMDVVNDAIDALAVATPQDQWRPVLIAVAPSMISVLNPNVSKWKYFNF